MKQIPPYRKASKQELDRRKDEVCKKCYEVYEMLRHNNIQSTGILELAKMLQELFDFYDDGKMRE